MFTTTVSRRPSKMGLSLIKCETFVDDDSRFDGYVKAIKYSIKKLD